MPEAWRGRSRFTVAELGFGTGLNIAALLHLWRRERDPDARLHVFTIEGFPLSRDDAARALAAWPELADEAAALLAVWPSPTPGFHRMDLPGYDAAIDLAVGDAAWALDQWGGAADAWFLDGFSPAINPAMWSDAVLDGVRARSAPGARLATFTVAGAVRRGLAGRGFQVDKRPGHGRKRERLEARLDSGAAPSSHPRRVAVIGAGIAGAACARALTRIGLDPVVIERDQPGAAASGFPAALVTPRLDVGDEEIARLYAQALARAVQLYEAVPGAVIGDGVLQLEQAPRDANRHAHVAAQSWWPDGAMIPLDAEAASASAGEPIDTGGLHMRGARVVHPAAILDAWLGGVSIIKVEVASLARDESGWRILDASGDTVCDAEAVILASGWGLKALQPDLSLAPVAGQADWVEGVDGPAAAWGGYTAPTGSGVLFGSTHDRGVETADISDNASTRNLDTLRRRLPNLAARIDDAPAASRHRRAGVRATTPDRLPLAGTASGADGLFILGGLGSRGFCAAPLLAEYVAALIAGAPSPLPRDLARRVAPRAFAATRAP